MFSVTKQLKNERDWEGRAEKHLAFLALAGLLCVMDLSLLFTSLLAVENMHMQSSCHTWCKTEYPSDKMTHAVIDSRWSTMQMNLYQTVATWKLAGWITGVLTRGIQLEDISFRQERNDQWLTRWVPYDGYIRHQNDHLSGRMTDISVMGEWQVAGVGGTRPLRNVLGEALEGRFSFEARNYLFSFQSYVRFEEFYCFPRFERFGAKRSSSWDFGFDDVSGVFLRTPLRHRAFFCKLQLRPRVFFENFLSFFQSKAGVTCLTAMVISRLSKALWWWHVEN